MTKYKILNFKYFPSIIGNHIIIDKNTLFFKSYNTKYGSSLNNRPSYYGEIDNASKYLKSGRKLGIFSTKKKLKLLDIRYISQIINDLILLRKNNDFETIIKGYMTLALSYGLVSLYKQINLYKTRYSTSLNCDLRYHKIIAYYNDFESKKDKELFQNPLELGGIRIGETNNDVESTFILKAIFGDLFDGFICPILYSPYFDENNISNEILLFNPLDSLTEIDKIPDNLESIDMNNILIKNNINLFSVPYFMKDNETTYFQYGGKLKNINNNIDYIYEKNILIDNYYKNSENIKLLDDLTKQGFEFKKNMINNRIKLISKKDIMFEKNNLINKY
jgi:hypothetical protein